MKNRKKLIPVAVAVAGLLTTCKFSKREQNLKSYYDRVKLVSKEDRIHDIHQAFALLNDFYSEKTTIDRRAFCLFLETGKLTYFPVGLSLPAVIAWWDEFPDSSLSEFFHWRDVGKGGAHYTPSHIEGIVSSDWESFLNTKVD